MVNVKLGAWCVVVGVFMLAGCPEIGAPLPDIPDPPSACDGADDDYEPNDGEADATALALVDVRWGFARFDLPAGLHLCGGDADWFEVDLAGHPDGLATIGEWGESYLFVRARIAEVGLCGARCEEPELPEAPENTMTVEVFSKATGALITSATSARGNVWISHGDARYAQNVYIRVSGPPEARYDYVLQLDMREGLFEDECEC